MVASLESVVLIMILVQRKRHLNKVDTIKDYFNLDARLNISHIFIVVLVYIYMQQLSHILIASTLFIWTIIEGIVTIIIDAFPHNICGACLYLY